jgi:DNA topoisomerase-1
VSSTLIIVESPAKARTIERFLGKSYVVASSIGHIRDLPSRTAEIPAAYRDKPWSRIGVDIDNGFSPLYVVPASKKAQVKKLKELARAADAIYLATDEDREGEAIAWHLKEVLKPKVPVKRMVFHEITKRAIDHALQAPRDLDERLVDAQEARRILDRLFGYEVSPVLWRKVRPRLSAGRVQSVATRLVVEREQRRMAFKSADYWSVGAELQAGAGGRFNADLQEVAGRRLAIGRHFDPATGELSAAAKADAVFRLDEGGAEALQQALRETPFVVVDVQEKPFTQRPHPPFITSTLQQEAGRKLGYTAQRTMRVAQRLYERGYITYMRTDSTTLSQQALNAARKQVVELFGADFRPDQPRSYSKKVKGAQEAHEAIRPAGDAFRTPEALRSELDAEEQRLYELIWKRTLASQMKDATGQRTQVRIRAAVSAASLPGERHDLAGDALFSASGKVITFPGYLRAYVEGADDPEAELEDKEKLLPPLKLNEQLEARALEARQHATQPPARYTEASLVKELEERGIGRPSTYATIIQTIQDRGYVWKQGSALVPTLTAFAVVSLLTRHFEALVDYEFTARMESDLDAISSGDKEATPWLELFYFGQQGRREKVVQSAKQNTKKKASTKAKEVGQRAKSAAQKQAPAAATQASGTTELVHDLTLEEHGLHGLIGSGVEQIDAREVCSLEIGATQEGEPLTARVGRYGPYIQVGDTDRRVNIADDLLLDELDAEEALRLLRQADVANRELGTDPESGKTVYLKSGSFGPYVQLGDPELTPKGNIKKGTKPKMASLWPSMSPEKLKLEQALKLLSYPRSLGKHPESGGEITVQDGKFGPYMQMSLPDGKRDTRSLENHEQLETLDLAGAVELFAKPRQARRRQAAEPLAQLGESPVTKQQIEVRDGRFGPYVTDGQVNATIPRGRDPQKVSFADALELIAAREQRMRDDGKDPRAPKKTSRRKRPSGASSRASKKSAKKKSSKKAT